MEKIMNIIDHNTDAIFITLAIMVVLLFAYAVGYVAGVHKAEKQFCDKFIHDDK